MLSERLLRKWRKKSLDRNYAVDSHGGVHLSITQITELHERILRLTQELLDQHLIRKG